MRASRFARARNALAWCLGGLLFLATLTGCPVTQPPKPVALGPGMPLEQLLDRHNQRAAAVDRLWSRVVVEMHWVDEQGKKRFEQGNDSKLIIRKPGELALAIGGFDEIVLWAGCDATRYWLMYLRPPEGEPRTAYVGKRGRANAKLRFGDLPVTPDLLLPLLGLEPIRNIDADGTTIEHDKQQTIITLPAEKRLAGHRLRYVFDRRNAQPSRTELLNADGVVVLHTRLWDWKPRQTQGIDRSGWPYVPTRIAFTVPADQSRVKLSLTDLTDGVRYNKIKDVQFDFERLVKIQKVTRLVRVDEMQ